MKRYYVTLRDGSRVAWLLGPFKDHERAKCAVKEATDKACEVDPRCHFAAYGTASLDKEQEHQFPAGRLNGVLPHLLELTLNLEELR